MTDIVVHALTAAALSPFGAEPLRYVLLLSPPNVVLVGGQQFKVDNWRVLGSGEAPGAGDVAAYKESFSHATGHSGIVTGNDNGTIHVVAAGSTSIYQTTAGSKYFGQGMVITYRRYTGP